MRQAVPETRNTSTRTLRRAMRMRRVADRTPGALVLPVAGGVGGLLRATAYARLASVLDPSAMASDRSSLQQRLERRQARRSALLLVPDRATGMRFAGLWRLDLARIRVADLSHTPRDLIARYFRAPQQGSQPWHAV